MFIVTNKKISAIMNLLTCILMTIPVGIIAIILWIYIDYQKYKKKNRLAILLFFLFPNTLSAQYIDAGCQISFKYLENQKGKLEYTKDEVTYEFIPTDFQWEIIVRNNSSEEIQVNWKNLQFIINGRAAEVRYSMPTEKQLLTTIKSQTELSRKICVTTYTKEKASHQIYNRKEIRKGRNSVVSISFPVSIGKRPKFFTVFDFVIKKTNSL